MLSVWLPYWTDKRHCTSSNDKDSQHQRKVWLLTCEELMIISNEQIYLE